MGSLYRWIGQVGLLLVSTLLVLGVLEVAVRWVGYDLNESTEWRFDPDLGWTLDPEFSKADSINPSGFRHCPAEFIKPPNTKRLLIVGDSFTAAPSFPYRATYPGILESWLNEKDSSSLWQVISLAVNDWGSAQELIALREIGLKYDPDAIVVQSFPFNDFCNNSKILAYSCSLQDAHRPYFELREGSLEVTHMEPARAWARNNSQLFGLLENRVDPQMGRLPSYWTQQSDDPDLQRRAFFRDRASQAGLDYEGAVWALIPDELQPPSIQESWQVTEAIFAEIVALANQRRIPVIPLIVPFLKTVDDDWESVKAILDAPMEKTYGTDRFEGIFLSLGCQPISMRREIERGPMQPIDYFISPTDGHFGAFGHAESAAQILNALVRQGIVHSPPVTTSLEVVDLNSDAYPFGVLFQGITRLFSRDAERWRYGRERSNSVAFWTESPGELLFDLAIKSGVAGLEIKVFLDDIELTQSPTLPSGREWSFHQSATTDAGRHEIRLEYRSTDPAEQLVGNTCRINTFELKFNRDPETIGNGVGVNEDQSNQ